MSGLLGSRVLVTGGGGFLGGAIAAQLREQGAAVRSFSRRRHPALDRLGVEQATGDLADPAAVETACRGVEVVFHVAAKAGVWGPDEDYHRTNVDGTRHVLAACRRQGVSRLIYTSSPSVVFQGQDLEGADESVPYAREFHAPYPRTKAMAERMVRGAADGALRTVALRPHLIWGPGDNHLVPRIIRRARSLARVGPGTNRVDTVYVDNAARAHLLAADRLAQDASLSGRVYFISQGDPRPLWEMVDAILAAGGLPPVRRAIGHATARRLGGLLEAFYRVLRLPGEPPMTRFVADELARAHWFDISAARRDLGYEPLISTAEGLQRLAAWLRQQPWCPSARPALRSPSR
jgi:nucleoside-diphosphate-sugar epimerase